MDTYVPTKYGIIFKEKIVISPVDHTSASLNIKMLQDGTEFDKVEGMSPKYFRVDILDNGVPIYSQNGYNQITISHFMFKCNQGNQESARGSGRTEGDNDGKHNYVIQALFDLHEWPEGKDESNNITW